jgi:hypothetical protein
VSIITPSFYRRGIYGQSFKLEKKPKTLILGIAFRSNSNFAGYSIIEKYCPEMPHLALPIFTVTVLKAVV